MALAAVRSTSSEKSGTTGSNRKESAYEPIVLRTYDYPNKNVSNGIADTSDPPLVASSSSLTVAQALAATTALPGVVHSVKAQLDDKDVSFMDGGLFAASPLHVAIDEARQLYPRRPLGVVLSIGYSDTEDAFRDKVIKVARRESPNLHFHRLAPSHITTDFKIAETSLESVVEMEEKVHDFICADTEVSSALDITMEKLYSNQMPQISPEYHRRQAMLQNSKFQERARSRQKLREVLKKNSSQSVSTSGSSKGSRRSNFDSYLSSPPTNLKHENVVKDTISATDIDVRYSNISAETSSIIVSTTEDSHTINSKKEQKENTSFQDSICSITEKKGPRHSIIALKHGNASSSSVTNSINSDLSLPSSTEGFSTICLKNETIVEDTIISTTDNDTRYSDTSCNKCCWWAACIPCFTSCSGGCNVVPIKNTNEVYNDNNNLKIKAISMNRGGMLQSN